MKAGLAAAAALAGISLVTLPAAAAITPPSSTSGASSDGSLQWVTSNTTQAMAAGQYSMARPSSSSAPGYQTLYDPNGDTINTFGASYGGFLTANDPGNGGFNNPNGGANIKVPAYFANTTSKSVESYVNITFATPVKFFSALVTGNNATGSLSFYKDKTGGSPVMTLSLQTIGYYISTANYYSDYLSVFTDDGSTFSRVQYDIGDAAPSATYGDGGIGNAYASTQSPVASAAVPEPGAIGLSLLAGLGACGALTASRRNRRPV